MPLKRATESASRAGGAIERFIERTLAPRLEEIAGEVRGLRGEMQQFDKRLSDNIISLRNEVQTEVRSLRTEVQAELRSVRTEIEATRMQVNTRIDALSQRLDDALDVRERLVAVEAKLAARGN
jgi:chromosome segregation ATPase